MPEYGDELSGPPSAFQASTYGNPFAQGDTRNASPADVPVPVLRGNPRAQGDYRNRWQRWMAQASSIVPMPTPLVSLMRRVFPQRYGAGIFQINGFIQVGSPLDFWRIYGSVFGNPTGYRCVEAIRNNFSRPAWLILPPGTDWQLAGAEAQAMKDHPLGALLNNPSGLSASTSNRLSATAMQRQIGTDLEIGGKSFWFKDRVGQNGPIGGAGPTSGPVLALRRMPVQRVTVYGNQDDELLGFVYTDRMGRQAPVLPEEVLYFRYPDPERMFDGIAPARVATLPAETDSAGSKFNLNILQSDGAMPGYVILEGLTREQFAEWKQDWEAGTPGRTRFLRGSNARYVKTAQTNQELTYHELREDSQDDILRTFGVPRAVAFDVSHETYANAEREQTIFMQHNILPKWVQVCDEATTQLSDDGDWPPCVVGLNLVNIPELQDSRDALVDRGVKLTSNQVWTVNEFRKTLGMPPVPWGDEPVAPSQPMSAVPLSPIGTLPGDEPAPLPHEPPATQRMGPGAAARQRRVNGNGH